MEQLKNHADHYLDGLITPKEFIAALVGALTNHWDSLTFETVGDDLANKLALMLKEAKDG